jgi:hypothetical protein
MKIGTLSFFVLMMVYACQDTGPDTIVKVFKPEDLVGTYKGYCVTRDVHFDPNTSTSTTTRDTFENGSYEIHSLGYYPNNQGVYVYGHGDCQVETQLGGPLTNLEKDTVQLMWLSPSFKAYIYIDTLHLTLRTYHQIPQDGYPGLYESWGYYEKM